VALIEERLVIEKIELRRPARHEQVNDALRLRREMRLPKHTVIDGAGGALRKHVRERDAAETHAEAVEELAAIEMKRRLGRGGKWIGIHRLGARFSVLLRRRRDSSRLERAPWLRRLRARRGPPRVSHSRSSTTQPPRRASTENRRAARDRAARGFPV